MSNAAQEERREAKRRRRETSKRRYHLRKVNADERDRKLAEAHRRYLATVARIWAEWRNTK